MILCGSVDEYQCFGRTCCFHLQGRMCRQQVTLKCWYQSAKPHGVTCHKTALLIFTVIRTSTLISYVFRFLGTYHPSWPLTLTTISTLNILVIRHLPLHVALLCSVFWINWSSALHFKCHCTARERCHVFWLCLYSISMYNYNSVLYKFAGSTFHRIEK
jgi:hypothetical protein